MTHGANNTIGITFANRYWIEDVNGAALTIEGEFAYSQVPIVDKGGKTVLTHVAIPFVAHNPRLRRFRNFRSALLWLLNNRMKGKPEIKGAQVMVSYRTAPPPPQLTVDHGMLQGIAPGHLRKYSGTPEMYRRRGMKGHALFMAYGGVNFRAMRERMRKGSKQSVTGLIPVAKRRMFNDSMEAAA